MTEKEFEKYYNLYSQELFGIAYSYTRSRSDSEDIIQNVFVKMIVSKKNFKSDKDLKYWLIRLTMNESIDLLRSKKKENQLNESNIVYTLKDNNTSEFPDLLYYISKLDDKYRRVIILHYYNNYNICRYYKSPLRLFVVFNKIINNVDNFFNKGLVT